MTTLIITKINSKEKIAPVDEQLILKATWKSKG